MLISILIMVGIGTILPLILDKIVQLLKSHSFFPNNYTYLLNEKATANKHLIFPQNYQLKTYHINNIRAPKRIEDKILLF